MLAPVEYNKTMDSVINKRPVDAIFALAGEQEEISAKQTGAQDTLRARLNAQRQNKVFEVGEMVLVKRNRRLGNKLTPLCEERVVEADLGMTALIQGGCSIRTTLSRATAKVLSIDSLQLDITYKFCASWQ